jgi:hypothetical protein
MAERVLEDTAIPLKDQNAMALAHCLRNHELRTFNARELRWRVGKSLRDAKDMDAACEPPAPHRPLEGGDPKAALRRMALP